MDCTKGWQSLEGTCKGGGCKVFGDNQCCIDCVDLDICQSKCDWRKDE